MDGAIVAQAASATVLSSVPLLTPAASNGSTLKADLRSQTPRGFLASTTPGEVSLSYAECPGCQRSFATDWAGYIPAHRSGKYPFPRAGQPTAPACPGSRVIVLEA